MNSPAIYKDSEGSLYGTFCDVGDDVAKGVGSHEVLKRGCPTMACACGSDESPLIPATPEETKNFWDAMGDMAGEALAAIRGNW